jgi:hypothetical protein
MESDRFATNQRSDHGRRSHLIVSAELQRSAGRSCDGRRL